MMNVPPTGQPGLSAKSVFPFLVNSASLDALPGFGSMVDSVSALPV